MMNGPLISRDEMMHIPGTETSDPDQLDKAPVVSVIVITYNHEAYIRQCLDGILAQKVAFPIEVIIGEDKSTDRTLEIILEYSRKHPAIFRVVTSEQNVGLNANFLRVFGRARGQYLAFCEGDDYWTDPDKLSKQVAVMERFPDTVLCGARTHAVGPEGQGLGESLAAHRPYVYRPHYCMEDLVLTYYPHTTTFLLRSAGFELPRCADSVVALDFLLVIKVMLPVSGLWRV